MFKTLNNNMLTDAIAVLIGTRPGIIKMSPLVHELIRLNKKYIIIHTGQHYSGNMDQQIMNDNDLPPPDFRVEGVENYTLHGEQTAEMLKGIEKVLIETKPKCLLVCGDANTNLAGALAARKLNIEVGHVEAGLRSRDWNMPEEHNRIMIDHISDYLFAPTKECVENLSDESVKGKVLLTGNTIVDATNKNLIKAKCNSKILNNLGIDKDNYILFTAHREENVDNTSILKNLLNLLSQISAHIGKSIIFPMHPRTRKNISRENMLEDFLSIKHLQIIEPQGYLDFLNLIDNATVILTDSGGIQEEACILGAPCVTMRDNTERPESVYVGANVIAGTDPDTILQVTKKWLDSDSYSWNNPYGDGDAAKRIIKAVV